MQIGCVFANFCSGHKNNLALNSKYRTEKLKTKEKTIQIHKNQNTEKRKPSFAKRLGRKCRLILTLTEQNNDHTCITHKIQFCSSFKS